MSKYYAPTREQKIEKIQARVDAGHYDSWGGQRPYEVFIDKDGDIAVAYHANGDSGSMPRELKVDFD